MARTEPSLPTSVELGPHEIEATHLLKRKQKKRTEQPPWGMSTVGQITRWIVDLGGYIGKPVGGAPGAITIRRGLSFVLVMATALVLLMKEGNCDECRDRIGGRSGPAQGP